jgi:hypothetical protein
MHKFGAHLMVDTDCDTEFNLAKDTYANYRGAKSKGIGEMGR